MSSLKPAVRDALAANFRRISYRESISNGIQLPPDDKTISPFLSPYQKGAKKGSPVLVWHESVGSLFRGVIQSGLIGGGVLVAFTPESRCIHCLTETVYVFDKAKFLAIYGGQARAQEEEEEEEEEDGKEETLDGLFGCPVKEVDQEGAEKEGWEEE